VQNVQDCITRTPTPGGHLPTPVYPYSIVHIASTVQTYTPVEIATTVQMYNTVQIYSILNIVPYSAPVITYSKLENIYNIGEALEYVQLLA